MSEDDQRDPGGETAGETERDAPNEGVRILASSVRSNLQRRYETIITACACTPNIPREFVIIAYRHSGGVRAGRVGTSSTGEHIEVVGHILPLCS